MNPTHNFGDLAQWLRAGATGVYSEEAAAELLIAHRTWLLRADFVTTVIEMDTDDTAEGDEPMAFIDWQKVATLLNAGVFPCTGSEAALLSFAASLAGRARINLTSLTSLDSVNLASVLVALAHAGGHRNTEVRLG